MDVFVDCDCENGMRNGKKCSVCLGHGKRNLTQEVKKDRNKILAEAAPFAITAVGTHILLYFLGATIQLNMVITIICSALLALVFYAWEPDNETDKENAVFVTGAEMIERYLDLCHQHDVERSAQKFLYEGKHKNDEY